MSFSLTVYKNPDDTENKRENILAAWDGWPHRWSALDDLIKAGKLTQTRSDNFPSLYRGLARDLLPVLPADRQLRISLYHTPEMLQERIDKCSPDTEVCLEIWDLG